MMTLTLTDTEAESFRRWREHQDVFEVLLAHGIFDIRNGSAELHFNSLGQLASLDAHVKLFRAPKTGITVLTAVELASH